LRDQIKEWMQKESQRAPQLTAILIGEDPASQTYVKNKMKVSELVSYQLHYKTNKISKYLKAAIDVGIMSETRQLPKTTTEEELMQIIDQLNHDSAVDGILVQLPLPEHINERKICNFVSCEKDVDGFNEKNVGRLCLDMNTLIPCTPLGVQELLKRSEIETFGKHAVVVGRSKNVGMPVSVLLHADGRNQTSAMDCTVTICHRFTPPEDLKKFCLLADIIVVATGIPGLIREDMVKPGACIIDVGITRIYDEKTGKSKLVGDVDFENVKKVAGHITPVPGRYFHRDLFFLYKSIPTFCVF
jgi:methylenetetrahydrofolate dehydrogenase(NAD+)/5,10-methenyltetrahydrofolate cyclohydrolase